MQLWNSLKNGRAFEQNVTRVPHYELWLARFIAELFLHKVVQAVPNKLVTLCLLNF